MLIPLSSPPKKEHLMKQALSLCAAAIAFLFLTSIVTNVFADGKGNVEKKVGKEKIARPNIILIYPDDHSFQTIGAYGSVVNKTPNIDRLAEGGMRFNKCLVTNSICGPCRAVIQTGKYSHKNGFYDNGANSRFDSSQQTFPKLLQKAGYQTAIIGKWHLKTKPEGYDYSEVLIGQGPYFNPVMLKNGKRVKYIGYTSEIITDLTMKWMQEQRDPDRPFMLMFQHKAPHRKWDPTPKYYKRFEGVTFAEPETLFDDYSGNRRAALEQDMTIAETLTPRDLKLTGPDKSLTEQQKADWHEMYDSRIADHKRLLADIKTGKKSEKDLVRWKYQCYMRDYLSCIASVDDSVGRLLDYLDEAGLTENTVIVYSADQGFYMGEHGWFDKRFMYKESFRTPLLVRWPGVVKQGTVNNDLVSNLDIAETFLDMAGVSIPADMQGRSFVPILQGKKPSDWRTSFYYQYYEYPAVHMVKRHYGVYDGRYKLIHFYNDIDKWELYDTQVDPNELQNVYGDPKYTDVQKRLHVEILRQQKELEVPEDVTKVPENRQKQYRRIMDRLAPIIEKRKTKLDVEPISTKPVFEL